VASETSSVHQVIDRNSIGRRPLKGRAVFELALLAPGAAQSGDPAVRIAVAARIAPRAALD